jgi:acetyl-CoA carboxylase carboxyltransferase component
MENNKVIQVNWGTINVPTIIAVLSVFWYTATHQATQDSRIGVIEDSRAAAKMDYTKRLDAIEADNVKQEARLGKVEYQATTNEANILAANERMDRYSDAIQDVRQSIAALSTKFEVVSTKIDNAFPFKKSELTNTPPELARRN